MSPATQQRGRTCPWGFQAVHSPSEAGLYRPGLASTDPTPSGQRGAARLASQAGPVSKKGHHSQSPLHAPLLARDPHSRSSPRHAQAGPTSAGRLRPLGIVTDENVQGEHFGCCTDPLWSLQKDSPAAHHDDDDDETLSLPSSLFLASHKS